jgi:hypothetical protein
MKFLAFIILLMVVLAQFIKADTQNEEPKILLSKPNGYAVYVSCIDGYKYMFYRATVIQMTEKNKESEDSKLTSIPVSCK